MTLALVLVALFALSLDPALAKQVETTWQGIIGATTSGSINPIFNKWILAVVIFAGAGFTIWLVEAEVAKKRVGQDLAAPPVQSIGFPAPPTFGSSSGLNAGPFSTSANVSGGGLHGGGVGSPGRVAKSSASGKAAKAAAFGA